MSRALERGISAFDTANAYVDGESERILGRALAAVTATRCLVATKVGFGRTAGKPEGLSPRACARRRSTRASSGSAWTTSTSTTSTCPDHATPIEETLERDERACSSRARCARWGVSNYASWQILEMIALADARGACRGRSSSQAALQRAHPAARRRVLRLHAALPDPHDGLQPARGRAARAASTRAATPPRAGSRFDNNALYQRALLDRAHASSASRRCGAVAERRGHDARRARVRVARGAAGRRLDPRRARLGRAPRRGDRRRARARSRRDALARIDAIIARRGAAPSTRAYVLR